MLKIVVNQPHLKMSIDIASKYLPSTSNQHYNEIVISGKDGLMQISSSNMIETIILKNIKYSSSTIVNDFMVTVDCKKLQQIVNSAKADIEIEFKPKSLKIKSARQSVSLPILEVNRVIDDIEELSNSFNIDASLLKAMKRAIHAIDPNNAKFELCGVLIEAVDNKINIVSTDTRRLSCCVLDYSVENDFKVIIPKQSIDAVLSFSDSSLQKCSIDENSMVVLSEDILYSTKLINGKYPEWQRIVPKDFKNEFKFNRKNFLELIKEVSIMGYDVQISVNCNEIVIFDPNNNVEVRESYQGPDANMSFGVNAKYILDFIQICDDEEFKIIYNGDNLPVIFIGDDGYKEVVMPIFNLYKSSVVDSPASQAA